MLLKEKNDAEEVKGGGEFQISLQIFLEAHMKKHKRPLMLSEICRETYNDKTFLQYINYNIVFTQNFPCAPQTIKAY